MDSFNMSDGDILDAVHEAFGFLSLKTVQRSKQEKGRKEREERDANESAEFKQKKVRGVM